MAELSQLTVLVTRPEGQADALCHLIEQQGGMTMRFPLLKIEALITSDCLSKQLLQQIDWLIFISRNAVNFALNGIGGKIGKLKNVHVAAVGKATADALLHQGIQVDLLPENGYNSEALLEMSAMRDVNGQRIVIVRGQGGREKLAETLRARGAVVDYLEVYKRAVPKLDVTALVQAVQHKKVSVVTITSVEALNNLMTLVGGQAKLIIALPLLVISRRIAEYAQHYGFTNIVISAGPLDSDIVTALIGLQRGEQWQK